MRDDEERINFEQIKKFQNDKSEIYKKINSGCICLVDFQCFIIRIVNIFNLLYIYKLNNFILFFNLAYNNNKIKKEKEP